MAAIENDVTADVTDVTADEEIRICLFNIGDDAYAIPVELLIEIIIPQKIFPVPTTPSHVLGVINLRGNIVPIVDIRPALSLPLRTTPGQLAIVRSGSMMLGIVVDAVTAIIAVPVSSIRALPPDAGKQQGSNKNRARYLQGLVQHDSGVAALLNMDLIIDEIRLT